MNGRIGRNEACSCGSGKKFKKCCGRGGAGPAAETVDSPPQDVAELLQLLRTGRHAELEGRVREQLASARSSALLWKLLGAALHGQKKDALEALQTAAVIAPRDAEAQTNLGNALRVRGRLSEAADNHRRAIGLDARYADAHNNLGSVLKDLGDLEAAVSCYRQAISLKPGFPLAHHNLGIALRALGRPEEALGAHRRALSLAPDFADAHAQLGSALRDLGRQEEAMASYRRALLMEPEHTEALLQMGNILLGLGRAQAAAQHYRQLLAIAPEAAEVHGNLGNALREMGQLQAALEAYQHALRLAPQLVGMHTNLGNALTDLGRFEEAVRSYRYAIEHDPSSAKAHSNLGSVLRELGQLEEAEASLGRAISLEPSSVDILANFAALQRLLGHAEVADATLQRALELDPGAFEAAVTRADLATDRGDFEVAESLYLKAFALDADSATAWAGIVATRRMTTEDAPWLAQAEQLAARPRPPRDEVALRFAMGKYLDDVGDYDRAFANYHRGNELVKTYRPAHDRDLLETSFAFVRQLYDVGWIGAARTAATIRPRPVFVVGMPRSGTSLAEQILASHPDVFGAGELSFWKGASQRVAAATLESGPDRSLLESLSKEYGQLLGTLAGEHLYVVDKMPGNFVHLGMIHAALPEARIIHMRRNPIDTCLSIYFQNFHVAASYANDLDDLAHYHDEYRKLMSHWCAALPSDRFLEVPYEELVSQPQVWSRRMVEFAGLSWDPACLESHNTRRTVRTFSRWQVRQKINTKSVARWRRYADHVTPLLRLAPMEEPMPIDAGGRPAI